MAHQESGRYEVVPTSTGTVSFTWNVGGGAASSHAAVSDYDDNTYIYNESSGQSIEFDQLSFLTPGHEVSSITSIQIRARAKDSGRSGTTDLRLFIRNGDGDTVGSNFNFTTAVGNFLWYEGPVMTNHDGDAFTNDTDSTSGIKSMDVLLYTMSDPPDQVHISAIEMVVNYLVTPTGTYTSDDATILSGGTLELKNGMTIIG